ncbi:MAG TPA: hypothetical protein VGK17_02875, partial [Propionicimonas sp.]
IRQDRALAALDAALRSEDAAPRCDLACGHHGDHWLADPDEDADPDPTWPGWCDKCGKGMIRRAHECLPKADGRSKADAPPAMEYGYEDERTEGTGS